MIRVRARGGAEAADIHDPDALWIDLESPQEAEEHAVEAAFGIDVPTPAERSAVEESARFYEESGALFLTATLLGRREDGPFVADMVTFILAAGKLITVRQIRPRAFDVGKGRASARIDSATNGADVATALLEGAIERLADLLSEAARESNELAAEIFNPRRAHPDLRSSLRALGRIGATCALAHDSLSSILGLLAHSRAAGARHGLPEQRLAVLRRDAEELERMAQALQTRLSYLQDGALGLVNATQTDVLKALSLATMAFVPPTLIASVFGMNFKAMTWFETTWGPWTAFALMMLAPAALFGVAKWRGWF